MESLQQIKITKLFLKDYQYLTLRCYLLELIVKMPCIWSIQILILVAVTIYLYYLIKFMQRLMEAG